MNVVLDIGRTHAAATVVDKLLNQPLGEATKVVPETN